MTSENFGAGTENPRSLDALERALEPVVGLFGCEVVDTERVGRTVRIIVDGTSALNLDRLAEISQAVSSLLDERPDLAPSDRYELELSSPGLERRLRRSSHFARAIGSRVAVRTVTSALGARRAEGLLQSADGNGFSLTLDDGSTRRFSYADVDRAHTVFDWKAELASAKRQANQTQDAGVSR